MEEQFVLRVPPALAARLDDLLQEGAAKSPDKELPIHLSFQEDGQRGTFTCGNEKFQATLYDLPCVVESFKTYDDIHLVKSADVGQMILVQDPSQEPAAGPEFRHGLAPPFRDVRKRWFRQDPDIDPALVASVEKELVRILQGGAAKDVEVLEQEEEEVEEAPEASEGTGKERKRKATSEDAEERRKHKEEKRRRKEEKKRKKLLKKQKREQEKPKIAGEDAGSEGK